MGRDTIRQSIIRKLLLERLNHLGARVGLLIPGLELVSLLFTGVPAHGGDVDHAVAELDERARHLGDALDVGDVAQHPARQTLVFLLAEPADEGLRGQLLAHAICGQAVLGEAEVEEGDDADGRGAQLFFLFDEVGATNLKGVG